MNEIFKGMDNAAEQINDNFENIADYVVEQGEDYTKWASGKLECWTTIPSRESVEFTRAIDTYARSQYFTWNFPVTFSSTPAVVQSTSNYAGSTWAGVGVADAESATYRYLTFLSPTDRSVGAFSMYAVGKWK